MNMLDQLTRSEVRTIRKNLLVTLIFYSMSVGHIKNTRKIFCLAYPNEEMACRQDYVRGVISNACKNYVIFRFTLKIYTHKTFSWNSY